MPYQIDTVEDLVRVLEEHPEWRERLREVLLTEEERALPQWIRRLEALFEQLVAESREAKRESAERFRQIEQTLQRLSESHEQLLQSHRRLEQVVAQLVERHDRLEQSHVRLEQVVAQLVERHDRLEQSHVRLEQVVAQLVERHDRLEQSHLQALDRLDRMESILEKLLVRVDRMEKDLADVKGYSLENKMQWHGEALLGRFLRKPRRINIAEFVDELEEQGLLTDSQLLDKLRYIDLIVQGRDRRTGEIVYIIVEVSWILYPDDAERAVERASILQGCGYRAFPAVIGEGLAPHTFDVITQKQVLALMNGSVLHAGAFSN